MVPPPHFAPFMVNGTLQNHPNQPARMGLMGLIGLMPIPGESFAAKFATALRGFTRVTPTMKNVTAVTDLPATPPMAQIGNLTHCNSFGTSAFHTFLGLKNWTEISGHRVTGINSYYVLQNGTEIAGRPVVLPISTNWYFRNGSDHMTIVHTLDVLMNKAVSQMTNSTAHSSFRDFHTLNMSDHLSGHRSFAEFHTLNRTEAAGNLMARSFVQFGSVANSTVLGNTTSNSYAAPAYAALILIVIIFGTAFIVCFLYGPGGKSNASGLRKLKGSKWSWKNGNNDGYQQEKDLEGGNQNHVERV